MGGAYRNCEAPQIAETQRDGKASYPYAAWLVSHTPGKQKGGASPKVCAPPWWICAALLSSMSPAGRLREATSQSYPAKIRTGTRRKMIRSSCSGHKSFGIIGFTEIGRLALVRKKSPDRCPLSYLGDSPRWLRANFAQV